VKDATHARLCENGWDAMNPLETTLYAPTEAQVLALRIAELEARVKALEGRKV